MSNNKQNNSAQPTQAGMAAQPFQPFYYYTANGQVQIGYPQMLAGMYNMPFYYNNAFLQQQAAMNQQQTAAMNAAMNFHQAQTMPSAMQAPNTNHTNPMNNTNNNMAHNPSTKKAGHTGISNNNNNMVGKKDSLKNKKLVKKLVQAQPSSNSESSDHGVHFNSRSKNESSDHGDHGSSNGECSSLSDKNIDASNQKSELVTKVTAVKPK